MSFDVIGVPSSQTAFLLILYVIVNGLSLINPLSRLGASSRTGDAWNSFFWLRNINFGRTYSSATQCIHDEFAHWSMGLMQSGHCSAPRTIDPPFFWVDGVACVFPVLLLALFLLSSL